MRNHTAITTFILLGLTEDPQLQVLLFIFLFLSYVLSITGNLTIIILTFMDSHLKTPMYFFSPQFLHLRNLIHNSMHSQILVQYNNWRQNYYVIMLVLAKYFLLGFLGSQNFFSWQPCPMTAMWPSANPFIT